MREKRRFRYPFSLSSPNQSLTDVDLSTRHNPARILFIIIDKAHGDAMVGVIGLLEASSQKLENEDQADGGVPVFHCKYIKSNTLGVLLRYALELLDPDTGCGGPGFHRMQWLVHAVNIPSHAAEDEGGKCCRVGTGDPGVSGIGIEVRDGDPLSRWEDGIALYFHCVWMIGRRGFDRM